MSNKNFMFILLFDNLYIHIKWFIYYLDLVCAFGHPIVCLYIIYIIQTWRGCCAYVPSPHYLWSSNNTWTLTSFLMTLEWMWYRGRGRPPQWTTTWHPAFPRLCLSLMVVLGKLLISQNDGCWSIYVQVRCTMHLWRCWLSAIANGLSYFEIIK